MKDRLQKEIRFIKIFLPCFTIACLISAYIHADENNSLVSIAILYCILGIPCIIAYFDRKKVLNFIDKSCNFGEKA